MMKVWSPWVRNSGPSFTADAARQTGRPLLIGSVSMSDMYTATARSRDWMRQYQPPCRTTQGSAPGATGLTKLHARAGGAWPADAPDGLTHAATSNGSTA